MRLFFSFVCFVMIIQTVSSQITFERTYGGVYYDIGLSVAQTFDGGYVITGITAANISPGERNAYLIKTDATGDTTWTTNYGTDGFLDEGWSVAQTSDSGYILAGLTRSFGLGEPNVYLVKTDPYGDTLWTNTFGGLAADWGGEVKQTNDGGYIIAGSKGIYGMSATDVYLIKTDVNGDTLWTKGIGGSDYDHGLSVLQTSDDGYVVLGSTYDNLSTDVDIYIIKTDSVGDTLWTKRYGGAGGFYGESIIQTSDSGYILTGRFLPSSAGAWDIIVIKTDSHGDSLFTKYYGGDGRDWGNSIAPTENGGYVIAGTTDGSGSGSDDVFLIRATATGDTLWTKTFGGSENEEGQCVIATGDGGFAISGQTFSFGSGGGDAYLIKCDSNGIVSIPNGNKETFQSRDVLQIFPNPTQGKVLLYIPQFFGTIKTIELFDCIGQLQLVFSSNTYELDLSPLTKGFYLIEVTSLENKKLVAKIIKE